MVTRIGSKHPTRHYLKQWRLYRGLTQQQLADRMPQSRDGGRPITKGEVSRWERAERGLGESLQYELAEALQIAPGQLFHNPEAPSVDELLRSATPEQRQQVFVMVEALVKRGSGH